eukprot:scaffold71971_cov69-Phaeocystis_antarctica.AAC.4
MLAAAGGQVECRLAACVGAIDVEAMTSACMCEQQRERLGVVQLDRPVERRVALVVMAVDIALGAGERLTHHRQLPALHCRKELPAVVELRAACRLRRRPRLGRPHLGRLAAGERKPPHEAPGHRGVRRGLRRCLRRLRPCLGRSYLGRLATSEGEPPHKLGPRGARQGLRMRGSRNRRRGASTRCSGTGGSAPFARACGAATDVAGRGGTAELLSSSATKQALRGRRLGGAGAGGGVDGGGGGRGGLLVMKPAVCSLTAKLVTSSAMEHAPWGRGVGIGASAEEELEGEAASVAAAAEEELEGEAASVAAAAEEESEGCCVSSQLRVCSSWADVRRCAGARRSNANRRDS